MNTAFAESPTTLSGTYVSAKIADIDVSGRIRPVDRVAAQAIAASMAQVGLLHPIDICRMPGQSGYRLVAGGHRLAAAELLGWSSIPALVRSADALERKAREIIENIFKADLSPIDRATFVAELYQVEKLRVGMPVDSDGRSFSAAVRWQKTLKLEASHANDTMSSAYRLTEEMQSKLGFDKRTIQRDLLLFKRLSPSLVERVRGMAIAGNATALRQLAALEAVEQGKVLNLIEAGKARGVNEALAIINKKPPADAEKKRLSTFLGTFGRMGRKEKLAALAALADLLPKGVRLAGLRESTMTEAEFRAELNQIQEAAE